MFVSTRNSQLRVHASEAVLDGLSPDGGLFVPEEIPLLDYRSVRDLPYAELATRILSLYLDDYGEEEIRSCAKKAYDSSHFEKEIFGLEDFKDFSVLELFHGQTLTFKDMALSLLPYLLEEAKKKHPSGKPVHILTATSGDTGSAVLCAFSKSGIPVTVFYPEGGVAPLQEKQMLYFTGPSSRAYALKESNFDTCQSLIKELLLKKEKDGYTSANSINIGRLLPQIVYYYASYIALVQKGAVREGEEIDVVVPSGNFGDILAGYYAKRMSLPIRRLVVASNTNRILTDFFRTGKYDLHRAFVKTISPSMDILISSNLERLLFHSSDDERVREEMKDLKEKKEFSIPEEELKKIQQDFSAYCASEEETEEAMLRAYRELSYVFDPHSAVAYAAGKKYREEEKSPRRILLVSTASPLKFPETVLKALKISSDPAHSPLENLLKNTDLILPPALGGVLSCSTEAYPLKKEEAGNHLELSPFTVRVPATSANLGPGFDVAGIALKLFNETEFVPSSSFETEGFSSLNGEENLVLSSYKKVFGYLKREPVPVRIVQKKQEIPVSRGLGSSAASILCGILGANEMLNRILSKKEVLDLATALEGHPDNASCAYLGGLVCSVKSGNSYRYLKEEVHPSWTAHLFIPPFEVSTKEARKVLPSQIAREDAVFTSSHLVLLLEAFKKGDAVLLKEAMEDRLHVPYRKTLIPDYETFNGVFSKYGIPFTISGSGSTMVAFTTEKEEKAYCSALAELKDLLVSYRVEDVRTETEGAVILREEKNHE